MAEQPLGSISEHFGQLEDPHSAIAQWRRTFHANPSRHLDLLRVSNHLFVVHGKAHGPGVFKILG